MKACEGKSVVIMNSPALHHRAPASAHLMISAILAYSICLPLATFLPTALTKLTWTNSLEMSAGSFGQVSLPLIGGTRAFKINARMTFQGGSLLGIN